jgi:hypothetical protein
VHFYQLDDKTMDQEFLSGKPVRCRAALQDSAKSVDQVKTGDFILVLLSSGKKYKGKVIRFESFAVKDYAIGELVISRAG